MKKLLLLLVLVAGFAAAQTPDCVKPFQFTAAGQVTSLGDNRQSGCVYWFVGYQSSGFSAISLVFQSATGGASAGAFGTYTGTLNTGSNPATNTTGGSATFTGYVGWYQMQLVTGTGTGTVTGALYGYKNGFSLSVTPTVTVSGTVAVSAIAGALPTGANGIGSVGVTSLPALPAGSNNIGKVDINTIPTVTVTQTTPANLTVQASGVAATGAAVSGNPVLQGGSDGTNVQPVKMDTSGDQVIVGATANAGTPTGNPVPIAGISGGATGGLNRIPTVCSSSVATTVTAGNTTQLVALVAGQTIRICGYQMGIATTGTGTLVYGTGANCVTGQNSLTPTFDITKGNVVSYSAGNSFFTSAPVANAVCAAAVTGNLEVILNYAIY